MTKTALQRKKCDPLTADLKERIRCEFVRGINNEDGEYEEPSIKRLAADHNVNRHTLMAACNAADWRKQKREYKEKHQEERDKRHAEYMAELAAPFDAALLKAASTLSRKIGASVEKAASVTDEGDMTSTEARNHATTLSTLQKAKNLALGQATEITKVEGVKNDEITSLLSHLWGSQGSAVGKGADRESGSGNAPDEPPAASDNAPDNAVEGNPPAEPKSS